MFNFLCNMDYWSLPDWILAISAIGTFIFSLRIYNRSKTETNHRFWNENLPVITIWSPCNISQSACDINIEEETDDENGKAYFTIWNFSKSTAYDLIIKISTSKLFQDGEIKREVYIQEIPTTIIYNENGYSSAQFLYSKFHVNPWTKEISWDEYSICDTLKNCSTDKSQNLTRDLYIKCMYSSSPDKNISKKIESTFRAKIECKDSWTTIKSIVRLNYKVNNSD